MAVTLKIVINLIESDPSIKKSNKLAHQQVSY